MKKQQRDAFRVHHMVQACELIEEFISGKTLHNLFTDRMLSSAVERQLEIIGEAASHVSEESQRDWPSINWKGMKGARNIIAHEYFRADYTKIWDTISHILPVELPILKELLAELESQIGKPEDELGV